jgi:hypothetical protein
MLLFFLGLPSLYTSEAVVGPYVMPMVVFSLMRSLIFEVTENFKVCVFSALWMILTVIIPG